MHMHTIRSRCMLVWRSVTSPETHGFTSRDLTSFVTSFSWSTGVSDVMWWRNIGSDCWCILSLIVCCMHTRHTHRMESLYTPWSIKGASFIFWIALWNSGRFKYFLACDIKKKLHANGFSFGHLTLKLLLHYLVICRSRSSAIYNNVFILYSSRIGSNMIN